MNFVQWFIICKEPREEEERDHRGAMRKGNDARGAQVEKVGPVVNKRRRMEAAP